MMYLKGIYLSWPLDDPGEQGAQRYRRAPRSLGGVVFLATGGYFRWTFR